jgi:hypothetical protein
MLMPGMFRFRIGSLWPTGESTRISCISPVSRLMPFSAVHGDCEEHEG